MGEEDVLRVIREADLHRLADLKKQFEAGDGFALMTALQVCARPRPPIAVPDWVADAYCARYYKVVNCQAASWDEVFGKPYPPGTHMSKLKERRELRFAVYNRIREILEREPETIIDEGLFERVGVEFSVSRAYCNRLYYEAKALLPISRNS